ncbi:acetyl-CoA carboxylase biotin carboxyl carrier protein [bacterium]|nr:acetyl-CoA carboxylase biotin carboxyl carrier protein [bacterium]
MEELGLAELEIEDEASRVRLVRAAAIARLDPAAGPARAEVEVAPVDVPHDAIPAGSSAIRSPMVGTFWRAPSPDAPPFVSPGDLVEPGSVLCLVEAMKTMNEVVAEAAGRVVSVRPENGAAVEYGTILFLVEPIG